MKVSNPITRKYIEVSVQEGYYIDESGTALLRLETKGRTGTTIYANSHYLNNEGRQIQVYGMGGATGHGWGGTVVGFATLSEIKNSNMNVRL